MGQADTTRFTGAAVDIAAVRTVANRFDAAAQALSEVARIRLGGLAFGGTAAGRAHLARGAALRAGLGRLAGEMTEWGRAAAAIATPQRGGAQR
ncbi:ESX-1 secretion-associated protein [Mycobacterium sp.]|uniref:ESX-1 secretion-associated protein n=1 Tax=Mycobacterium sp. TaxID=1785 RepID=UPI0012814132|nr:ESX-1 secretion-associated protein [Mycobacterium sp.]KAA8966116.1 MAG: ESX-1 secretion-associated protein [Mycobacterium sp.]